MNEGDYIRGYRLKQEIGRGSYGDVWLAEKQMDFGGATIYYALKFLRNKNEEGVDIEKVIKEIVVWTKASSHSNVISIRDSFTEHGKYIIVSDYADGGSLKNRDFSFEEAVKIIESVLAGIEYLHTIPLIHRDIKPENILLKNGVACISDFGLAREFDKTQSTGLGGSINYFSPEMAKKELDNEEHERNPLDDLWATAVTFYQLITGDLPFKKLGHIIKCQREPFPENFPTEIIGFFNKAFHKNRRRRFQSAKKMRADLRKAVYPEAGYEDKIEELTLQFNILQIKILESQNNANLLYKMVAEERIKSQQLAAARQEVEKKSLAEKENVQKLQDQTGILQNELQNLREQMEKITAENVKLKKHLRVLRNEYTLPLSKKREDKGKTLQPIQLEKSFFNAGDDFLNKRQYDQAINQFTEAIKLNSGNPNAYFKRGIAYNGRGAAYGDTEDYDNAIQDYYQATVLKGNNAKGFSNREGACENNGHYKKSIYSTHKQSIKDYKRLLKLNPIFNSAHNELKKAKKERRGEILKFMLKWSALLLAFSGLYISTYKFTQPVASNTASFLRHNFYDLGQVGEKAVFALFMAAGIALSLLFVIGLATFLKNALHSHVSERAVFIAFSGVGLLLSVYIIHSFFFTNNYYQAANDCYEKKDYVCAVENYTATINWSAKYWLTSENEAYSGRGNAYLKMGDVERAVKDYNEAVKLNPNDANAAENLKLANNFRQKKSDQH
ncbi:MAG: protein kinase [Actinomycetota bacterium]